MLACPSCGSVYARSQEFCGLDGTRLVEVADDPLVGRTVGRYTIERAIGSGGMARVYRGRHAVLDQRVAIKILHGELSADRHLAKRFEREAKSLSRIRHKNVVEVLDFGRTQAGLLYMVMELLEGRTLAEALRRSGAFSPDDAAQVVRQIALGLSAAHDTGYVHRDLKPGNLVLAGTEIPPTVKILDFGLVGLIEGEESDTPLTRHGTFFGTPTYMSPEQTAGEKAGPPADMYALGVVLYELLSGRPPFQGEVRQLAQQHLHAKPPRLAKDHGGLSNIAYRLLAKEPVDRPTTDELIAGLDELEVAIPVTLSGIDDTHIKSEVRARRGPARPSASEPRPMAVPVPIDRDEFSVMDGAFETYEKAALGATRRGRKTVLLLLSAAVGAAAYGLYEYERRGPPPLERDASIETPLSPRGADLDRLAGAPAKADAGIAVRRPGSTPPPEKTPSEKSKGPEAAEGLTNPLGAEVVYDEFLVFDDKLRQKLRTAGRPWDALETAAPTAAAQWGLWFRARAPVPREEFERVFRVLTGKVQRMARLDEARLVQLYTQVFAEFEALAPKVKIVQRTALRGRLKKLEDAIAKRPMEAAPETILGALDALAADIRELGELGAAGGRPEDLSRENEVSAAPEAPFADDGPPPDDSTPDADDPPPDESPRNAPDADGPAARTDEDGAVDEDPSPQPGPSEDELDRSLDKIRAGSASTSG